MGRYMSIWFKHLLTDRYALKHPELRGKALVLVTMTRGRKIITAANVLANQAGICLGMTVADARALCPQLLVFDNESRQADQLLQSLAGWCIRFTPVAGVDLPDGLVLDISGCAHLWGGEGEYLKDIITRLRGGGYYARGAIADTIAIAWAVARYGHISPIIEAGNGMEAIMELPTAALRLDAVILERMDKLGLTKVRSFLHMPRTSLRRRFGPSLLLRIDQALGLAQEIIDSVLPAAPYQERVACLEPIRTRKGIEIALQQLLDMLCKRLEQQGSGLRVAVLRAYRVDGHVQGVQVMTSYPSRSTRHLMKLFELQIAQLRPDLGFELFVLEAPTVELLNLQQETLWNLAGGNNATQVAELVDRLSVKLGSDVVSRYLPDEHHWPERSIKKALSLQEQPAIAWPRHVFRPVHLLSCPEAITVSVPLPDYPPMNFRYQNRLHIVRKADGPERIEQEWWMDSTEHRDYYSIEDENGHRFWLFRLGSYDSGQPQWFVHGFFA